MITDTKTFLVNLERGLTEATEEYGIVLLEIFRQFVGIYKRRKKNASWNLHLHEKAEKQFFQNFQTKCSNNVRESVSKAWGFFSPMSSFDNTLPNCAKHMALCKVAAGVLDILSTSHPQHNPVHTFYGLTEDRQRDLLGSVVHSVLVDDEYAFDKFKDRQVEEAIHGLTL